MKGTGGYPPFFSLGVPVRLVIRVWTNDLKIFGLCYVTFINETVMLVNMKLHSVLSIAAVALLSIYRGAVRSN